MRGLSCVIILLLLTSTHFLSRLVDNLLGQGLFLSCHWTYNELMNNQANDSYRIAYPSVKFYIPFTVFLNRAGLVITPPTSYWFHFRARTCNALSICIKGSVHSFHTLVLNFSLIDDVCMQWTGRCARNVYDGRNQGR